MPETNPTERRSFPTIVDVGDVGDGLVQITNAWPCERCGGVFVGDHYSASHCNELGVDVQLCGACCEKADAEHQEQSDGPTGYRFAASFPGASAYWRPNLEYLAEFLRVAYGMQLIAKRSDSEIIITDATTPSGGKWWVLTDNGGELNVSLINDSGPCASVPYSQVGGQAPIGRVAWFCRCVMQGAAIERYDSDPLDDITLADMLGK